ncbi:hypothetical protein CI109_104324 [Kwoniella shandongensis]|uniref:Uncharacterized protein n=1 Tax=Kwoniella shandongensis TaxID=1734106 RepID=A0A5M6C0B6_9TREE|nr:uncharacterized protein CI109_004280 [Kwoniella shandongensis]KAA5527462.1 hypothetical protein CI109_004280 [Kwoniella shandongensis]
MTDHKPHEKLPPHLRPPRPPFSQHSSAKSFHSAQSHSISHPHAQQHEFVPSFDPTGSAMDASVAERALFDEASPYPPGTPLPEGFPDTQETGADSSSAEQDWDTVREGSIARRPRWRRPSPLWIYPFLIVFAMAVGSEAAPKAELMIHLACLAHPPSRDSHEVIGSSLTPMPMSMNGDIKPRGLYAQKEYDSHPSNPYFHGNSIVSVPIRGGLPGHIDTNITKPQPPPLSPSDKWFLRLQHDIYEYRLAHNHTINNPSNPPSPTRSNHPAGPAPTEPLPKPNTPFPGEPHPIEAPEEKGNDDASGEDGSGSTGSGNSPYKEIDPQLCKRDPRVQAASAKLSMVMTLSMGLLSALTTGFWGQTSDRWGRTKVLTVVFCGAVLSEVSFILVATFPYLAPGGYRALLIGPFFDGLLGGYSTVTATINAYVSDCTPDGSRVTVFARLMGMFMLGYSVGPALGSFLIYSTGNIMIPFYINVVIYILAIPLGLFLLPESLSSEARLALAKNVHLAKEAAARRDAAEREWEDETPPIGEEARESDPLLSGWSVATNAGHSRRRKRAYGTLKRSFRKIFKFLEPLELFLPREREDDGTESGRSRGRDWNLTFVGMGVFFVTSVLGVMAVKVQFAFFFYGWTSTQLGPFMSFVGFFRAFTLIVLVPLVMRYVKPYFIEKEEESESEAQAGTSAFTVTSGISANSASAADHPTQEAEAVPTVTTSKPKRTAHLDLWTVRICLLTELIPYIVLALGPSQEWFVGASAMLTLAAPTGPAANSLALSLLPDASQSGRLFGGLGFIQALGATLISPLLFGTLFASTVGWYAPAVFVLAAVVVMLALLCFSFVRLEKKKEDGREERGRSRNVKRVNSTSVGQSGFASVRSGYGATGSATGAGSRSAANSAISTPVKGH